MPQLIINTYVTLTYELKKKIGKLFTRKLLGPGPGLIKKKNLPGRGLTKVEKHCSIEQYLGILTTFDVNSGSCLPVILNTFIQRRCDVTALLTHYAFRLSRIPQLAVTNYQPTQTRYFAFESKSLSTTHRLRPKNATFRTPNVSLSPFHLKTQKYPFSETRSFFIARVDGQRTKCPSCLLQYSRGTQIPVARLPFDMIHLLIASGLTPGGSSTVYICTQIHRTTQ